MTVRVLDGSYGEGGGQILRTALALATVTGQAVVVTRIRAGRPQPGLQPQHLTVVRALAILSQARVQGDALGSTEVAFAPGAVRGGRYRFDVGVVRASAGAVTLLFHALLPALLAADGPTELTLVGGTHVPWSPPVHHLRDVFLRCLAPAGVTAHVHLRRWGFYPAGGGLVEARVEPTRELSPLEIITAPPPIITGVSAVARLPRQIAERQRDRALARLRAAGLEATISLEPDAPAGSPGTFLGLAVPGRLGASALGRRGVPAEQVADEAVDAFLAARASGAALDEHVADQLVPILALARGPSTFTCPRLTPHLRTVAWVVEQLLPVRVTLQESAPARVRVEPARPG